MGRQLLCALVMIGCGSAESTGPVRTEDAGADGSCNFAMQEVIYDGGCVPGSDLMCGPTRMRCIGGTHCNSVNIDGKRSFRCLAD